VGACTAPIILNLGTRWSRVFNLTPRPIYPEESTPVPTDQEIGRREKSLAPAWNRTPDRPAHKSVTTPTYAIPALKMLT
jgi:hypothetical protein